MNVKVFRTVFFPEKFPFEVSHSSKIMFSGSCFSENMGEKLENLMFDIDINPFGILYNPVSIKNSLDLLAGESVFSEENLFYYNEVWHSFYHHGRFSGIDKDLVLQKINNRLKYSSEFLSEADYLFITFGTSVVYELKETGEIVSNCHKVPAKKFAMRMLSPDEIIVEYFQLINKLRNLNHDLKIIFTVSPVRHLKNGFSGNMLSKSVLIYSISKIVQEFSNVFYFPAYEIVHDDLRDYRFYKEDLVHINEIATDYLFEIFSQSFFSAETQKINLSVQKILKARNHRPFNENTEAYRNFCLKSISEISTVENNIKTGKLSEIKNFFESKI